MENMFFELSDEELQMTFGGQEIKFVKIVKDGEEYIIMVFA